MALSIQDLEQLRKKQDQIVVEKLTLEVYKWEKILDEWLKNKPRGGTYRFYWFLWLNFAPSYRCLNILDHLYTEKGWSVCYGCDREYITIEFTE